MSKKENVKKLGASDNSLVLRLPDLHVAIKKALVYSVYESLGKEVTSKFTLSQFIDLIVSLGFETIKIDLDKFNKEVQEKVKKELKLK